MADGKVVVETDLDNSGIEGGLKKLGSLVKAGIAAVGITKLTSELVQVGTAAVQVGANFEAGMSNVAAISGATGKDLESLTTKAKEMGAKTKFSATEASEAFSYMAMAGWKTSDMLSGIDGIMNLAAASGEDLASVSDIVTDAITAFGLSASDSGHFADVLAAASSNANTNVGMLGESFKYIAPVAGAMGYSVEDVTAALGLMANSSVKGSMAGTSLKTALSNMVAPTDAMAAVMEEYGISLTNTDGSMKTLGEVMQILREKLGGLDEATQTAAASTLFGKEAMAGMLAIVNASPEDYEKLTSAIQNADGTAQKMSDTMQDNLDGSITILKSSLEGLGIQFYESIDEQLKGAVDAGIKSVERLSKAFEAGGLKGALKEAGKMFGEFLDEVEESDSVLGSVLRPLKNIAKAGENLGKAVLPPLVSGFKTLGKNLDIAVPALAAGAAAIKGYSIAKSVSKTISGLKDAYLLAAAGLDVYVIANGLETVAVGASTGAITLKQVAVGLLTGQLGLATAAHAAFNAVVGALGGPIGLAITAVTALAAGVVAYSLMTDDAEKKTYGLSESQQKLIDKSNETLAALDEERTSREKNVQAIDREFDSYDSLVGELQSITDENGNVKAGYEDRAKVITGILSDALGIEIELLDGQIQKYGEVVDSIKEVIDQKKAEALLSSMQDDMAKAYEKTNEAMKIYKDSAEILAQKNKSVEEATKAVEEAQRNYDATLGTDQVQIYASTLNEAKKNLNEAEEAQNKANETFNNAKDELSNLSAEVNNYDELQKAVYENNTAKVEEYTNKLIASYRSYSAEALSSSKETKEAMYAQANAYITDMELVQDKSVEVADSVYQDMANAAISSIKEFNKLPGGVAQGIKEIGPEASAAMVGALAQANIDGKLNEEAQKDIGSFINGFSSLDSETQAVWSQAWYGALKGLEGFEMLKDPAVEGSEAFIESLIETLGVHSPARTVKDVFAMVWPGAMEGLDEGKDGLNGKGTEVCQSFLGALGDTGLLEGAKQIGSSIMESFGLGASSQSENSKNAGILNASSAETGAASINPTATGALFSSALNTGIFSLQGLLGQTGKNIADSARNGAGSVSPSKEGTSFGTILSNAISSTSGKLQSTGKSVAESAKSGAGSVDTTKTGSSFGNTFANAVSNTKAVAQSSAAAIASAANGARGLASISGQSAGYNFGAGFGGGIRNAIGSAVSAAASLASRALSTIKNTLGIHSPSKETYKLGDFTGAGFVDGLEDQIPEVQKIGNKIAEAAMDGMDVKGSVMQMKAAIQSENAKLGAVISQKAIYKMEQDNQNLIIEALSDKMDEFMDQIKDIQILINTNAKVYLDKKEAGYALAPAVNRKLGEFQELNGRGARK